MFTMAIISLGAAIYVLQLHIRIGPARQQITITWAPETSEAARRTAEAALTLRDGEEVEPGTWVYHVQDHSREAVRRIVTHPLVADTNHIYRGGFRILIDDPRLPRLLRRALEEDLGPAMSLAFAVFGFAVVWLGRRELLLGIRAVIAESFERIHRSNLVGMGVLPLQFLTIGFAFFFDNGQSVDENVHFDQIVRLAHGNWSLNPELTTLPGFHAIVAALVWVAGATESSVRLAVFGLSLAAVGVFHALARTLQPERSVCS